MELRIDLNNHRSHGAGVFSGRNRGNLVRAKIGADKIDTADKIELIIPEDVYSINSSFFLGLFGDTIAKHGEIRFKEILVVSDDSFASALNDAIAQSTQTKSLL